MEEALAFGWRISGQDVTEISTNERTQRGNVNLSKQVNGLELCLEIPFRATFRYSRPTNAEARAIMLDLPGGQAAS